jgi:H+/Cl- antiporter ClcA
MSKVGEMTNSKPKSCLPRNGNRNRMGVGVAIGAAIGAAFGASSGHMAQSVAMGVALGTAFAAIFDFNQRRRSKVSNSPT